MAPSRVASASMMAREHDDGWEVVGKRGKARSVDTSPVKRARGGGSGRWRAPKGGAGVPSVSSGTCSPASERPSLVEDAGGGSSRSPPQQAGGGEPDEPEESPVDKDKVRAKLWSYLYENVTGAVDEIYLMSEMECDEEHIQNTIDLLQACALDFAQLKERVRDQQHFERERERERSMAGGGGSLRKKPASIVWEVRRTKSSPKSAQIMESLSGRQVGYTHRRTSSMGDGVGPARASPYQGGRPPGVGEVAQEAQGGSAGHSGLEDDEERHLSEPPLLSSPPEAAWKEKRSWVDVLEEEDGKQGGAKEREKIRSLHAKLMSPDRNKKRSPMETKRMVDEKQARATRLRYQMEAARQARLARAAEEREAAAEREAERLARLEQELEERHERSRELREAHLATVIKRAGEETRKVNEVIFITNLEAQNKTMWIAEKMKMSEARRQERLKNIQERQKTAAEEAQERRQRLEDARREKIALAELRHARAETRREEMEAEREQRAAAEQRRRAEEVEKRAEEAQRAAEEQRLRLQARLQEGRQRRSKYLGMIKERAEMGVGSEHRASDSAGTAPSPTPLSIPSPTAGGDGGDGGGGGGGGAGERAQAPKASPTKPLDVAAAAAAAAAAVAVVATSGASAAATATAGNRIRGLRRRAKKLLGRLDACAWEWRDGEEVRRMAAGPTPASRRSWFAQMRQDLEWHHSKKNVAGVEGALEQLLQHVGGDEERHLARMAGLLKAIIAILSSDRPTWPARATEAALRLLHQLLQGFPDNCEYVYRLNLLPPLVPLLVAALGASAECSAASSPSPPPSPAPASPGGGGGPLGQLELLLSITVEVLRGAGRDSARHEQMGELVVGYIVAAGVVPRLRELFSLFDQPQAEGVPIPAAVEQSLQLLELLTERCAHPHPHILAPLHEGRSPPDSAASGLVAAARETCLMGLPSLLTAVLLNASPSFAPSRAAPEGLPPNFPTVALSVMRALNNFARLDLPSAQETMGASDMRVELFHLISFLLSFCTTEWAGSAPPKAVTPGRDPLRDLLREVVVLVGHFVLLSSNRDVLAWGKHPTIMHKLAALPAGYFEGEGDLGGEAGAPLRDRDFLLPSLLAACFKSEMNCTILHKAGRAEAVLQYLREHERAGPAAQEEAAKGRPWPSYLLLLECRFPRSMWAESEKALAAVCGEEGDGKQAAAG